MAGEGHRQRSGDRDVCVTYPRHPGLVRLDPGAVGSSSGERGAL